MKRIFVVLTLGAMIAVLVAGPAAAKAEVETLPIQFIEENPCTGEFIEWSGTTTIVSQDIQNENGRHFAFHSRLDITGTGLETGDTYRLVNSGTNVGNEVFIEGEYVPSESEYIGVGLHTLVVSDGASPNFLVTVVQRFSGDSEPHPGDVSFFDERCTPELETAPAPEE